MTTQESPQTDRPSRFARLRTYDPADRCRRCGYTAINIRHEMDPATAPEGPDYYADMLHELHPFESSRG